jgi:ABC-type cobalt transport system substrate-binding protein
MFMRKTHIVGLLVVVALALPIYAAAADQSLKASETGTFQVIGPCDSGGIVIEVTGTGHATVLGSYTAQYQECFQPATGTVTSGSFTLTAANGDKIFGTYAGQASPADDPYVVAFDDPGVINGGTGRFAAASGTVNQSGQANLATGEYDAILTGTVSSPASA